MGTCSRLCKTENSSEKETWKGLGTKRAMGWGRVPRDLEKELEKDTKGKSTVTGQCQEDKETEPQTER